MLPCNCSQISSPYKLLNSSDVGNLSHFESNVVPNISFDFSFTTSGSLTGKFLIGSSSRFSSFSDLTLSLISFVCSNTVFVLGGELGGTLSTSDEIFFISEDTLFVLIM